MLRAWSHKNPYTPPVKSLGSSHFPHGTFSDNLSYSISIWVLFWNRFCFEICSLRYCSLKATNKQFDIGKSNCGMNLWAIHYNKLHQQYRVDQNVSLTFDLLNCRFYTDLLPGLDAVQSSATPQWALWALWMLKWMSAPVEPYTARLYTCISLKRREPELLVLACTLKHGRDNGP